MRPAKTPVKGKEDLLDLLETQDLVGLRAALGLEPAEHPKKNDPDLFQKLDHLSNSSLLTLVVGLKSDTIEMLGDIFSFLMKQHVSVRTTGCFLSRDELIKLKPQQINAVTQWSPLPVTASEEKTWEDLMHLFIQRIRPFLKELFKLGRPGEVEDSFIDRMMDLDSRLEFLKDVWMKQVPDMDDRQVVSYDKKAMVILETVFEELVALQSVVEKAGSYVGNPSFTYLNTQISFMANSLGQVLKRYKRVIKSAVRVKPKDSRIWTIYPRRRDEWLQFREAILFSGRIAEAEALVELFRYDLFRHRPQLYEIWVVCSLLDGYLHAGCGVELCQTRLRGKALVWNLNYSKSTSPIAKITNPATRIESFLFFQLFRERPGAIDTPIDKNNDMPDLALLPGRRPDATPYWIVDPKHSWKGYRIADYEKTAYTYYTVFAPGYSIIAEYYPRENEGAFKGNDHVLLFTDVSPQGGNKAAFLEKIRAIYKENNPVSVVMDVSDSYKSRLQENERIIQDLSQVADLVGAPILFGDERTVFRPVIAKLRELRAADGIAENVLIFSDLGFEDISPEEAREELGLFCRAVFW